MFSYRHAFHAGNHADVLKHMIVLHICQYMTQKDKSITYIDTHAGIGMYQLTNPMAQKSGEAETGILKLMPLWANKNALPKLLHDYLKHITDLNQKHAHTHGTEAKLYPGSPYVASQHLREIDRLRIFELHPTDMRLLDDNLTNINLPDSRDDKRVLFKTVDGFVGLKANLPPPSRRGFVLIDPSYEIKDDYAKVAKAIKDAMTRFPTGTYAVWYPILARPESANLPVQLERIAQEAGVKWLHATLAVDKVLPTHAAGGLQASGMFVINPPWTLAADLQASLPVVANTLKTSAVGGFEIFSSEK
ncbi:23S rRNA (adenine(2030)-N(6))-methyltransferase RlmJ [Hydromonas duriensis]|uniref:Ribosomal RNA large subunit methyltransferase J n=1 Tax=Hydromonas duriensis TaxID=1527608 RepID=A0A4R6Y9Q5_9BURK|nr:23S rRNA (adenine(2030)-N(6))-methyltransferase RlmJ [Hydromonas duriensis]TDR32177.1 23S rRNA (adenine2030-N6)-methyltransferase [Hydromonas duriensis]